MELCWNRNLMGSLRSALRAARPEQEQGQWRPVWGAHCRRVQMHQEPGWEAGLAFLSRVRRQRQTHTLMRALLLAVFAADREQLQEETKAGVWFFVLFFSL